jgi:hypothetical protein
MTDPSQSDRDHLALAIARDALGELLGHTETDVHGRTLPISDGDAVSRAIAVGRDFAVKFFAPGVPKEADQAPMVTPPGAAPTDTPPTEQTKDDSPPAPKADPVSPSPRPSRGPRSSE